MTLGQEREYHFFVKAGRESELNEGEIVHRRRTNPDPRTIKKFPQDIILSDLGILMMLAALKFFFHLLTNGQYGFHRDELGMLDDARHLAWGYVAYPPVTPFIARLALELFGPSLIGLRLFSALAQSGVMILAGLMTRELGGSRLAQILAALAAAIAPVSLGQAALFEYVSFDFLWWVLTAYLILRLLKSENPRWWLGIGAVVGVGMMTKYTMSFFVAGVVGGALLTRTRRHLKSAWLWGGIAVALFIFLPNLIWQIQHDFISLDFLRSIHVRDIARGRTEGFLIEQLFAGASVFTIPLWVAGLYFYLFNPAGGRYRMLGWMYLIPLLLFFLSRGRSYYLAPAYPMLMAAGVATWQQWLARFSFRWARFGWGVAWAMLGLGAILGGALMLPITPVKSDWWNFANKVHENFPDEIGWPELVATVAKIYASLPPAERPQAGILTGNYGEAGAINLYGPAHGLPKAISGINSYWLRGYGDSPPQVLIVVGYTRDGVERFFERCDLAGRITNRYGIENEETKLHPDIFICRKPRQPWPALWRSLKHFG